MLASISTSRSSTMAEPFFLSFAREHAEKLEKSSSPVAKTYALVMRDYEQTFLRWEKEGRPENAGTVLAKFLPAVRIAMDLSQSK